MTRVAIAPQMFRWARERAGMEPADLGTRFPKLADWEAGDIQPTLRQLEEYARATHAPVGFFFLPEPPDEPLPLPDFRTVPGQGVRRPSPDLLDTIYVCQQRQDWYRDHALIAGQPPLGWVAVSRLDMSPVEVAAQLRERLGFSEQARRDCSTWTDALRMFVDQVERIGVLVMVSGIVLNNTTRVLDVEEFRGFALTDPIAPLVFVNGTDSKAAQMFTLAHELAHLCLGQTALSDVSADPSAGNAVESWCNRVAAELLVPLASFRAQLIDGEHLPDTLRRLARHFKVSTLVVLRRLLDAGRIDRPLYFAVYHAELQRLAALADRDGGGGDFYRTTASRVGKRFARALVESTLEGRTLYRDAFQMLGIAKAATFNEFGRSLGFPT